MKNILFDPSHLSLSSQVGGLLGTGGTQGTHSTRTFSLTDPTESHLNHSLLENVRHRGDDVISACPACREEGKDSDRDNLRVFASGAYNCIAHPKDREHNRRIFTLVGVRGGKTLNPVERHEWRERRARERQREQDKASLQETAKTYRERIIDRWTWDPADIWESSQQRIDCELVELDPRHFLQSLFHQEAAIWTGEVQHSGIKHANRWRTVAEWLEMPASLVGPMTAPATWPLGTVSRTGLNVATAPFVVLDFDGFDGMKPETDREIEEHVHASLALTRWLREKLHWRLAAIVWTGGKSVHSWFHRPPLAALQSLSDVAEPLGIDAGLICAPEHPCRLPGQRHAKTGGLSKVLWLQAPVP